jgi:hypothetical protein
MLGAEATDGGRVPLQYAAAHVRLGGLVGEEQSIQRLGTSDPLAHVSWLESLSSAGVPAA